jgi:hypothetical protein
MKNLHGRKNAVKNLGGAALARRIWKKSGVYME